MMQSALVEDAYAAYRVPLKPVWAWERCLDSRMRAGRLPSTMPATTTQQITIEENHIQKPMHVEPTFIEFSSLSERSRDRSWSGEVPINNNATHETPSSTTR